MDQRNLWLERIFLDRTSRRLFSAVAFLALLIPSLILSGLYYHWIKVDLTEFTVAQREATARAVAMILKERLDRCKDLAASLAARVRFQQMIKDGRWTEAVGIMEKIPEKFAYIERIFLTDKSGTLMADTPALHQTVGENFSHRDWYKGVSRHWDAYVSGVYQRKAEPSYSVVAVASPIADLQDPTVILGVLVMQVRLETFSNWINDIDIESGGMIILVDHTGKIVSHPDRDLMRQAVDMSAVPSVGRILNGQSGTMSYVKDGDSFSTSASYEVVPTYDWGVIVSNSQAGAFHTRDETLRNYGIVFFIFILMNIALISVILAMLMKLIVAGVHLKKANDELEQKVRERTSHLEIANRHLKISRDELVRTNRDLEQFAYIASHDLQEPLRKVISFTQLLAKKYHGIDDEGRQFMEYIVRGGERMQRLIRDLLEYSRSSGAELKLKATDLNEVLLEVVSNLAGLTEESQARITHDRLPVVNVQPTLIARVFENVIGNALKYGKKSEPVSVHIAAREEDGDWVISISDNGIGIDAKYNERIFQIFERLHTDEEYTGTGIGLAISRRIVERHGGKIWVESSPGQGSTFKFTIPKERPEQDHA